MLEWMGLNSAFNKFMIRHSKWLAPLSLVAIVLGYIVSLVADLFKYELIKNVGGYFFSGGIMVFTVGIYWSLKDRS